MAVPDQDAALTGTADQQRPESLMLKALDLFGEYERTGERPLLTDAVRLFRAALSAAVRCEVPDSASYYNNLGYALHELAEVAGDASAQAEAVRCHRSAVAAVDRDNPRHAGYLCSLVSGLRALHGHSGDARLLREAVSAAQEAIDRPGTEPGPATRYAVLGAALGDLYAHDPDPAVLIDVIAAYRHTVDHAERLNDPDVAVYWSNLTEWLHERYERTGDTTALADGIRLARKAVAATSGDTRLGCLSSLGQMLKLRFVRTDDLEALAESAACGRAAVAGTWPGHPSLSRRATNLSGTLTHRYERTGDTAALAEAIVAARQAVAAAAATDTERGGYLSNLYLALELDWARTENLATLVEAVRVAREAVMATPPGHHLRPLCLTALGGATSELYDRTGDDELLTESVQARRDTLAITPADDPERAGALFNLGQVIGTRFGRTGHPAALDEAVGLAREAVAATPIDDPARALRLAGLAGLLDDLFMRTRDPGPLAEAIAAARAALAMVSADDPLRATLLGDLASVLHSLFLQTRNSALLKEAVLARREALAATPAGHRDRYGRLVNLASVVQALAIRTDDFEASVEASELVEYALEELPHDDPARALCLSSLARIYRRLHQRAAAPPDELLDEAIRFAREAVAATPTDQPDHTDRLALLGDLLLLRSHEGQEPTALAEALRLARQAVSAVPPGDPDYARRRNLLGFALWMKHQVTRSGGGDAAMAAEAWQCFAEAARQARAPAALRINSYLRAAQIAGEAGRTAAESLAAIEAAVDLLPGVLPGQLDRPDQEYEISRLSYLASDAAQAAVSAGRPDRAVELLEQTRGVLVADELDRRTGHDHRGPLTMRELGTAAADGPIIYVYTGELRCDALILSAPSPASAGQVRHVHLGLSVSEVWEQARRLAELVTPEPGQQDADLSQAQIEQEILAIIGWLRTRVTGPVLAALGYDRPATNDHGRPRIWWCPVGVFAFFPLHAACLEEVVSSYAFSARSLRNARSQPSPPAEQAEAPLVIAVPYAPGLPTIPGADLEADLIAGLFPHAVRLREPTGQGVLAELPRYPVAHFACHATVNTEEPGRSQLFLDDHETAPLALADIGELRLAGGLAFLSACETAVTSSVLANEAVHLTGAFQLAGYQHVVGTLWKVSDRPSARLVRDFYAALIAPGRGNDIDLPRTAVALRHATRRLKDRYPDSPTVWAGHIHVGP